MVKIYINMYTKIYMSLIPMIACIILLYYNTNDIMSYFFIGALVILIDIIIYTILKEVMK